MVERTIGTSTGLVGDHCSALIIHDFDAEHLGCFQVLLPNHFEAALRTFESYFAGGFFGSADMCFC